MRVAISCKQPGGEGSTRYISCAPGSKCNRTLRSSFKHPKPRGRKQDRIREKHILAELIIIQLQSWKFIEFLTTIDTCSAINHRSLLLQREQTLQKRSSVATDLRTMRPRLEILLKAVPPFNSNMIILQKVVSCVCGRRGGTLPPNGGGPPG